MLNLARSFFCVMLVSVVWMQPLQAIATPAVEISSESVKVDHAHSRAEFTGGVVLTQGDFTLRCDRLHAWYVKGDLDHAEAFDHVRFHRNKIDGQSKHASFQKQKGVLVLFENASVKSPEGTVFGEKITHYIQAEKTVVDKTQDGRVHVIIDADEGKPLQGAP